MKDEKDKLLKNANLHLKLGKLLKKKRDRLAKQKIETIICSNLSTEGKVKAIELIDNESNKQTEILMKKRPRKEASKPISLANEPPPQILCKENFLFYLLFQFKKIAHFGKKTKTLVPNYFIFSLSIDSRVGGTLFEIQKLIQEILEPLHDLVEKSWLVLDKEEYNLIIAFYNFCDQYYKEFLQDFDYSDLIILQSYFFIIIQKERYKNLLIDSVKKGLINSISYQKKAGDISNKIDRIIADDKIIPSLTHIILALQMKSYKRYFRLKDIILTENSPLIKKNKYNAPPEVMEKLKQYLWKKEQTLVEIEKEYNYLYLITSEFITNWREPMFNYLKHFHPHIISDSDDETNLQDRVDDVVSFTFTLMKEFYTVFKAFISDKITIFTGAAHVVEEKVIPYSLTNQFQNLQNDYRLLTDIIMTGSGEKISLDRYKQFIDNGIVVSEHEEALFLIISNFAQYFYEISVRLYENYAMERKIAHLPLQERIEYLKEQDIFEKIIPYAKGRINLNYYLSNKTVTESYLSLMEFSVNFALFYRNSELIEILQKQSKWEKEITELKHLIKRIK